MNAQISTLPITETSSPSATDQIALCVAEERRLIAKRDYIQSVFTEILGRLGDEIDAVQTVRHGLMEEGFRQFDRQHTRSIAA